MIQVRRLIFLILILVMPKASFGIGNIFYVSKVSGASDANPCVNGNSGAAARSHISAGLACLTSGDILRVQAGTYNSLSDNFTSSMFPGGPSSANPTIIECETALACTIANPAGATAITIEFNTNINNVTIRNFIIDNNDTAWHIFKFDGPCACNNITISDNELRHPAVTAILATGVGNGMTNFKVQRNIIHDVSLFDVPGPGGNRGYGCYCDAPGMIIEGNTFYNNYSFVIHLYPGDTNGAIIRNNTFHDNGLDTNCTAGSPCPALELYASNHQVYNNLFYANRSGDMRMHGYNAGPGGNAILIANNTSYSSGNVVGFAFNEFGNFNVYRNNIILNGTAITGNGTNPSYLDNLCDSAIATGCSFASTPAVEFVAVGTNFHLNTGAVSRNKGINLTGTLATNTDKDLVIRPSSGAWDIGAYQFSNITPTDATPIENFVYSVGTNLDTLNGGSNWNGPWFANEGAITIQTAPAGLSSSGLAALVTSTAGHNNYSRLFGPFGTGIIYTNIRKDIVTGFSQISFNDDPGNVVAVFGIGSDGHLHGCIDWPNDIDLGAYSLNTTYTIGVELDSTNQPGKVRYSVNHGTPSAWINFCSAVSTATVSHYNIFDNTSVPHNFWVGNIGLGNLVPLVTDFPMLSELSTINMRSFFSKLDSFSLSELITINAPLSQFSINKSDAVTLSEVIAFSFPALTPNSISALDQFSAGEVITTFLPYLTLNPSDSIATTEIIALLILFLAIVIIEPVTLTELQTILLPILTPFTSETIHESDIANPIRVNLGDILTSDTTIVTEIYTIFLAQFQISATDNVTISETTNARLPILTGVQGLELINVSEAPNISIPINKPGTADLILIAESFSAIVITEVPLDAYYRRYLGDI